MTLLQFMRPLPVFCTALFFLAAPAWAARPFCTDDVGIVPAGTFELETAADWWTDNATFGFCLKHGLTDRMDLGVSAGRAMYPREDRAYTPIELGLKFSLIPGLLSLSFAGEFSNPGYGANLIVSRELGPVSLHGNLGYSAIAATNDADVTYGICCRAQLGRVSPGIEMCGTHKELSFGQIGAQCSLCNWCSLDIGIGTDFSEEMNITATSGLWFAFPITNAAGE